MAAERQSFLHDLPHAATFDHRMIRRTARRTTAAVQVRIDRVAPARKVRASNIGAVTETGSIELRAWHVVRVLSAPPRSRRLTEISRLLAKSPELAGLRAGAWSLRAAKWIPMAISAPLSLASKFSFLGNRDGFAETAPVSRVAVLQPEDRRGRVRWHVLDVGRCDGANVAFPAGVIAPFRRSHVLVPRDRQGCQLDALARTRLMVNVGSSANPAVATA